MVEDTVFWILLAVSVAVYIVSSLVVEHNLKKKNANQRICLEEDGARIRDLGREVRVLHDTVRCLIAEVDYHLHDGVADTICDAARDWRDGDISGAYMSRSKMASVSASLPRGSCRYCKMPLIPGEHVCKSCGALVVSEDTIWLWRGK